MLFVSVWLLLLLILMCLNLSGCTWLSISFYIILSDSGRCCPILSALSNAVRVCLIVCPVVCLIHCRILFDSVYSCLFLFGLSNAVWSFIGSVGFNAMLSDDLCASLSRVFWFCLIVCLAVRLSVSLIVSESNWFYLYVCVSGRLILLDTFWFCMILFGCLSDCLSGFVCSSLIL